MQNGIISLAGLFATNIFRIPDYQRAYAWEQEQLSAFLEDLRQYPTDDVSGSSQRPRRKYYLGTILLQQGTKAVLFDEQEIVDGQQRLTTIVIFIAVALAKLPDTTDGEINPATLRDHFIESVIERCQKFHTIAADDAFFMSHLLGDANSVMSQFGTPSARRLKEAKRFFLNHLEAGELSKLLRTLMEAEVMVYSVNNAADATQIFELQNDRGKRLTDLEAIKSFLMHAIYLNADAPDDYLSRIKQRFSNIFRYSESLEEITGAPEEDSILAYHCVGHTDWTENEWRNPKALAKKHVRNLMKNGDRYAVVNWIESFARELEESFGTVLALLEDRDRLLPFAELFVLGRLAPFWPLLIKTYKCDHDDHKDQFLKATRLMEIFAFRGYAISEKRADAAVSHLYTKARDFSGDFNSLGDDLREISHWWDIDQLFLLNLDSENFYDQGKDALYLLWRYENHLRRQKGQQFAPISWREYYATGNPATQLCIEHIAPQAADSNDLKVVWKDGDEPCPFSKACLHRLGNLVLDVRSAGAARGNKTFVEKLPAYLQRAPFLSQGELAHFASSDASGTLVWDVEPVKRRHQALIDFALKTWS